MDDKEKQFVNDLLDASLRNYSGTEPLAGLESRILAGVRARQRDQRHRTAWLSAFAISGLAVAVVGLVGFVALRGGLRRATPEQVIAKFPASNAAPTIATVAPPAKLQEPRRVPQHIATTRVDWRPQQFPTPRPLSKQEKLLLAYVQALNDSAKAAEPSVAQDPKDDLVISPLSITAIKIDPLDPGEDGDRK